MAGTINLANVALGFDATKIQRGVTHSAAELRKLGSIIRESESPIDRYNKELGILERAHNAGAISAKRMAEAQKHLSDKYGQSKTSLTEFAAGLNPLQGRFDGMAPQAIAAAAAVGAIGAAMYAAKTAVGAFVSEVDRIDAIGDKATQLGLRFNELLIARRAFGERTGMEESDIDQSLKKMQLNLVKANQTGEGGLNDALKRMGLEAGELIKEGPLEAISQISDKFGLIGNQAERMQLAMDLFGKSGVGMVPALDAGRDAIADMEQHLTRAGVLMSDDAAGAVGALNDQFERANDYLVGAANVLVSEMAPTVLGIAIGFEEIAKHSGSLVTLLTNALPMLGMIDNVLAGASGVMGSTLSGILGSASGAGDSAIKKQVDMIEERRKAALEERESEAEQRNKDKLQKEEERRKEQEQKDRDRIAERKDREDERLMERKQKEFADRFEAMNKLKQDEKKLSEDAGKDVKSGIAPALKAGSVEAYKFVLAQKDKAAEIGAKQLEIQKAMRDLQKQQLEAIKQIPMMGLAG